MSAAATCAPFGPRPYSCITCGQPDPVPDVDVGFEAARFAARVEVHGDDIVALLVEPVLEGLDERGLARPRPCR